MAAPTQQHLQFLYSAAQAMMASDDPRELLASVFTDLARLINVEYYFHYRVADAATGAMCLDGYAGVDAGTAQARMWMQPGEGVSGVVAQERRAVVFERVQERTDEQTSLIRAMGVRAYACHPLQARGTLLGTLCFGTSQRDRFTAEEVDLLAGVADLASVAVDRSEQRRLRMEAEAASAARERHLRAVLAADPECVKLIDRDFLVLEMNAAGVALVEADNAEDVVGACVLDYVAEPDRERVREGIVAAFRGEVTEMELDMVGLRGTRRRMAAHIAPLRDAEGAVQSALAITRDVTEREAALADLAARERHYRSLIENLSDLLVLLDRHGLIRYVSPSLERTIGYAAGDVVGRPFVSFVHHADRARAIERLRARLDDTAVERFMELRVRHRDGSYRLLHTHGAVYEGDGGFDGPGLVVTARDVTAERQMEQHHRDVLATVDVVLWEWDAATGTYSFVSPAIEQVLGYSAESWLADPAAWERAVAPDYRAAVVARRDALVAEARDQMLEYPLQAGDGRTLWVRDSIHAIRGRDGTTRQLRGVMVDITALRSAQEALRRSRDYYFSYFDEFPAMVWRSDATGATDYVNRAWLAFTGTAEEEELRLGWSAGMHPDDRDAATRAFDRAFAAREPLEIEYRRRNAHGEYRPVLDMGRPFYEESGQFHGYIGVVIDLGTQRALEFQLRAALKMEAIGRLAGGVAHDFNNILTAIAGHAALAVEALAEDSAVREDVVEIQKSAERASALTHQLLAFSRQQVLEPRVLDLPAVVRDLERMLQRLLPETIHLVVTDETPFRRVKLDRGQLEQVLVNLVVNARDAMPEGGTLTIATDAAEVTDVQPGRHHYMRPGSFVRLTVTDTGFGMDEDTLSRIFDPFYTTKETGKGTGLGLSTVYGIVKQSGGFIHALSTPGGGTTFELLFPPTDAPLDVPPRMHEAASSAGTETLLLVEDEPAVRKLAVRVLEREGYRVMTAANGEDALRMASSFDGTIDLLVTDVAMPVMGGIILARELRAVRPGTRVLYMTGYTDGDVQRDLLGSAGDPVLEKPFQPSELASTVRQVLDAATAG